MKKYVKKATALLAAVTMVSSLTACGGDAPAANGGDTSVDAPAAETPNTEGETTVADAAQTAAGDPFMKFAEPVEIHIGQQAYPTLKFPDGDTNEDNVYTRYLKDNFNIEVVVDWSAATGNDYTQKVNLCIASNTLPDGMQCGRKEMLAAAKSDLLYDFTELFPQYASPQVRAIMDSGDGSAYEYSMYNGKQVCTVGVDVAASGESMVNIRQDWLDELGLDAPETLDDIEAIAKAFKEKKPAGDATIPIAGPDKNNT